MYFRSGRLVSMLIWYCRLKLSNYFLYFFIMPIFGFLTKIYFAIDYHTVIASNPSFNITSEHDNNYGIVLSIWDRMFNTRDEREPKKIGLDLIGAENFIQLFSLAFITEIKIIKLFGLLPKGKK